MRLVMCLFIAVLAVYGLDLKTIKADFTQEIKNDDGAIIYSGKIYATRESKAYWRYEKPFVKEIFVAKKELVIYEPSLAQAIISRSVSFDFLSVLNSAKMLENALVSEINGTRFTVTLQNKTPHKITYRDNLDNEITITLTNVVLDSRIDEAIFEPKIPEGVDVIRE